MRVRYKLSFLILMACLLISWLALGALQQQKPVDPVNFRELLFFLVDLPGWVADDKPEGATIAYGEEYKVSQAQRSYSAGEKSLSVTVVDGAYVPMVYSNFQMYKTFEMDTSEQYTKGTTFKGYPGVESYEYEPKTGFLMVMVADRFLVTLEGDPVDNLDELKEVAEHLPWSELAALAK